MRHLNWTRILDIAMRDAAFLVLLYFVARIFIEWVRHPEQTQMQIMLNRPFWYIMLTVSAVALVLAQSALQ